ncbi:hypothetical protein DPMN_100525 [Dreissena polymorpha]|uniref:Uncharacterized protein n=1 Tax=Dreissena polymorpha TaxID=45954 RepID=A0A9D4LIC8_DREPO|nr:hypothetical protein DPMN_100525 [Dreissena polymorpha]
MKINGTDRQTDRRTDFIASLQATEERKIILNAKRKLKDAKNFGKVFIYKDQTNEERSMSRNLKTIVNVLQENVESGDSQYQTIVILLQEEAETIEALAIPLQHSTDTKTD